jgi:hypothetical protein
LHEQGTEQPTFFIVKVADPLQLSRIQFANLDQPTADNIAAAWLIRGFGG